MKLFCFLCLLCFVPVVVAQAEKPAAADDVFKKDATVLAGAVDAAVADVIPNRGPFQSENARATFLDGYGVIVTIETALEPPRNIFSAPKSPAETKASMNQRLSDLRKRLEKFLMEKTGTLQSVGDMESVTIIVYLANTNPDVGNFPSQLVLTAKKADPAHVTIR